MKLLLVLLVLLAAIPFASKAELVLVSYTGSVSSLSYADCQTFVNGNCSSWTNSAITTTDFFAGDVISVGNTFTGSFVYDSNAPLTAISSDGFQAIHLNSVSSTIFQGGAVTLPSATVAATGLGSFSIVNDRFGYDAFFVQSLYSQGNWFASVNFSLQDSTGSIFNSFAVPTRLDFSSFNANVFNVGFLRRSDGDQVQLYGTLNAVSFAAAVPEPSTAVLVCVGLVWLGYRSKRKAASAGRAHLS